MWEFAINLSLWLGSIFLAGTVTWYVSGDSLKGIEEHLITVQSSDEQWAFFFFTFDWDLKRWSPTIEARKQPRVRCICTVRSSSFTRRILSYQYWAASMDIIYWQGVWKVALNGKSHSHLKCPNFSETLNMHDGVESKPVQGKMLGQVHDLTLPIMDGTCTFWCVYFLHVNSLLIFFVSVCIYDWFIGSEILKYCHFSTELDLPSEGKIDRSSYNRVP